MTISGGPSERIGHYRVKSWFFPEGGGAQGELWGIGPFDCGGMCVDPSVLPLTILASRAPAERGSEMWLLKRVSVASRRGPNCRIWSISWMSALSVVAAQFRTGYLQCRVM
jgi:hypothetical protein